MKKKNLLLIVLAILSMFILPVKANEIDTPVEPEEPEEYAIRSAGFSKNIDFVFTGNPSYYGQYQVVTISMNGSAGYYLDIINGNVIIDAWYDYIDLDIYDVSINYSTISYGVSSSYLDYGSTSLTAHVTVYCTCDGVTKYYNYSKVIASY